MITVFTRFLTKYTTASLFLESVVILSIFAFMSGIVRAFKAVNRRALSAIGTTLMLSALLSACGGGGGGGSSDTPAPAPTNPTTPTFSVSSSNFSIDENFTGSRTVASVSNATAITVSQSNTGVVTVTNSLTQVNVSSIANATGRTVLTITATNGSLSATTQVTVTVNAVNNPTALTTPTFTVSSNNLSINEDFGGPRTVASVSNATAITVSQSNTGVVTVTNTNAQVNVSSILNANGRTTLTITATNGTLTATTEVTVTVNAVNDPPTVVFSSYSISTVGGFSPIIITGSITDVDNTTLNTSLTVSTTGVVRVGTATNALILSNIPNASGQTNITITVSDNSGSTVTQTIAVDVIITTSTFTPALSVSSILISEQEDFGSVVIRTTATDADGDTLTISVSPLSGIVNAVISTSILSTNTTTTTTTTTTTNTITNIITLTAVANANGTATLTVLAADFGGQSTEVNIVVVVAAVNDTPTITVPTLTLTVLEDFNIDRLVATFADVDRGDSLTVTVTESSSGVVTVITSSSSIQVASLANRYGRTTLNISVSDGDLSSTAQVVVDVTPVNDPPFLTVSTTALILDEDFAQISIDAIRSDVEGDTLTLTVTESTTGVVTVITTDSGIQVANIANANGQTTLTITVNDGTTNTSTQVAVVVNAVNDAPELIVSTTTLTLIEDFTTAVLIATTRSDVEGDTLTLTVSQSIPGVVSVITTASGVQVSNLANAYGQTTLTLSLSDGTTITSVQVAVSVAAVNDTPTLSVSTNNISTLGGFTPITINTIASDVEDANLTVTVTESTPGVVRVAQSANAIILHTIAGASGITTLTVSVVDSSGSSVSQTIVVNVTVTASATPVLTVSTNSISVQEDFGSVAIRTTASDSDSATLTLTVTPSMRLVTVAISTRTNDLSTITLTAIANLNGTATLTFRATDDGGQTNSTEIVVVVAAVNDTPTITVPAATLTVLEDFDGVRSVATFSDVDRGNVLTVAVTESNAGVVTITTSASGVSVAAIAEMNGRTTLNISVSDGTLSSTTQVVVDVTPVNDPPELSVSTSALTLAEDFSTAVVISATRRDIDNDPLTLTVSESTTGVVTVTTTVSGVSVAAINNANGATTLTISLSDGTTSTSTQVSVTVTPVNDPPTLSVSPNALTLNEDFATTEVITVTRSDVDGDTLTLTVAESATGVVTVTTTAAGVQVASILNVNGQTTLTFTVNDGRVDTTTQVAVIVNAVNDAPSLNIPTTNVVVDEDFATTVTIATATDLENNPLTITVAESTTGVVTVMTSTSGVQVASILNASGQTTLTIRVYDGSVDTTAQVVVTVTSVNDTPTITVSNNNITAVVDFTTITINTTASDVEDGTLSYSVVNSNTGVVTVSTSTNAIILSAVAGSTGQTSIVVRTTDSAGLSAMQTIAVNVTDATTPTLLVSTNLINVQEDFGSSVVIQTSASASNGGSIALSVSTSSLVAVVVSTPVSGMSTITNTITLTAINNANGTSTLTVQAESAGGLINSTEIVVVVAPVNDTPTLTIPNANLVVSEDFSVNNTIATAADIDGDTPIFSVVESMTGLVTVSTSAAGVSVSSVLNENGQTTLTITVSDGLLSSTAQVVVTVTPVNDPPSLTIPNATVSRAEEFVGGVTVASASDVDGNPLTFRVIESAPGVIRVTVTTSDVSISSLGDANGVTTLSISVSDGNIVSSTAQVVVNVTGVNDPPSLTVSTTALTLDEDFATVLIATTRTDIDSTSLTLTVAESATGVVTVTVTDAGVSVTRIENINGRTTLTITLSDNDLTSMAQVVVDVTPINDPPVLTVSTTALTLTEDFATVLIATTRTDIDSTTLTLTVAESATGVVTVTVTDAGVQVVNIPSANGQTTLTITLSDGRLSTTTQVVVEVTAVNDPPSLSVSTTALTLAEDFAMVLIATTRTDIDSTTLTLTVAESATGVVTAVVTDAGVQVVNIPNANGRTTLTITLSDSLLTSIAQVVIDVTAVNDPPALTVSTNTLTLIEDFSTAVLIATTRTDIDSNTLTLTVVDSPAGIVTVTTTDAGVQVVNIPNANGQTILTITLSDGNQSTTTQVVVNVTRVNDPPTINVTTTNVTVREDFLGTIALAIGNDVDNFGVNYEIDESNTGIVDVNVSPFELQMARIENANGVTTISFSIRDGEFRSSTFQVVVTVLPVNDPPFLTVSTNALTLVENFGTVLIGTTRADIDSNSLTLTVSESAPGIVTVQTTTAGVSVSSIAQQGGRTTLTITLSDGDLTTNTQVVINVTAFNDPPVLMVSTTALTLAENFGTVLIATSRTDADSTSLTFTVVESATGVVTVQTSTSGISVSSIDQRSGRTTLTIALSDGSQTITTQVVIVVTAVNDPPVLAVSTTALTLDEDFDTTQLITVNRSDVENDTLTFSVTQSSSGIVSVSTSSTGVQVVSIANANGQTTLTITLSDSQTSVSTQVVVTVNAVNDTPTLTVSTNSITTFGSFSTITINTTASDIEDGTLSFSVTASTAGVVTVTTSANAINLNLNTGVYGQTNLTVRVIDSSGTIVTQTISVNVINSVPILVVSTYLISLQEDFVASGMINISTIDLNGDTVTISVSSTTRFVDVVISTRTNAADITLSAIENANGTTTLTVQAMDTAGLSVSTEVVVVVAPINDPPTLSVTRTALTLNEDFATTQLITVNRSDIENDTITLSVAESMSNIVRVSTSTAGVQVVSIGDANGQTTLTITVSDGQASASTQVLVTVNAVNDTPTLTVSSNSIATLGGFSPITIYTTASDVEDTNISFTVIPTTTGVVRVTTSTNAIMLNNIPGASGQTILTVRVVDSSGTIVTQSITVNVTITASAAPVVTVSTNLISVSEDFGTSVIIQTTATDADGDTITVSVSASRPIVTAVISTPVSGQSTVNSHSTITNSITLTAIGDANGTATLTVVARDPGGQSHSTEIVVVVAPVQDTPTINIPTATLTLVEDFGSIQTIATASDADGDTLNVSVVQSNPGIVAVTTSVSGVSVSSIGNANGQTTLTITVNDGNQDTTAQVVVNVTPVNDPPSLNIPSATLTRAENFTGAITVASASDIDSTTLTITVIESSTGVIRVTASASDVRISSLGEANGITTLVISLSDGDITTTAQVVVTVTPVNDPPALSVTTTALTLNEDFATTEIITVNRSDIDSNTLTLTVVESATGVVSVTTTAAGVQVININNANGVTTLTISLSDGDLTVTTQVVVTVTPVNDPPTLSVSTTALTLNEDFSTTEVITVSRNDIDSNTLTLTVVESATRVVTVTTTDAGVQVTNIADANGRTTLTIQVSDGDGGLASTDVVVVVNAVEDTPTLSVSTTNITAPAGFTAITINTTANDADEGALSFAVQVSTANVVRVTTSANAIVLNAIAGALGRTTLTVRTTDNTGRTAMQTIAINVVIAASAAPVLTVSTNLIRVDEDFSSPVVIRTTATDADGDALMISISSSSHIVDAVLSTPVSGVPVSGVSSITNMITLTALSGLSGITTLTVQAIDGGGIATTQQIVVVVNAVDSGIPSALSTSAITLSVPGSQLDRIVTAISISNPDNKTLRAQIQVTTSGDNIFSANPAPVVSFTTNALTTTATLTSAASTAQLYFTIRPDQTGTATLVVQLTDLDTSLMTQQTMVVRVNSVNVPPTIVPTISSITRLTVFSGRLYANDVTPSTIGISRFLTTARALGGHLLNINSVEEYSFVRSPASSGLVSRESYFGLVLPKRLFPGELSWITHDSTIAYGYSSTNGITNHTLYPGHYPLPWAPVNAGIGLLANRFGPTTTVSNWPIFSDGSGGVIYLVDNGGDIPPRARDVIYEFPQGLPIATNLTPINVATTATVQFTGYDLNGTDIINTTNWSGTDPNGGSVVFNPIASSTGVQSVSMTYSPPTNFGGQTTVVVTLTVDGLSTTVAKTFIVPPPPTIALSTNAITLDEDFGTFDIATTATEQGFSTSLPFWVQASTSGVVTISTSANNIQLSAVSNVSGTVTLTVRTIDSASIANSTQVVVIVQSVNDTPTVTVSSDSISILGGFTPITIYTTATDIEQGVLPITVQASPQGVVSISTRSNTIVLSPTVGGSGRTTLTVSAIDDRGKTGIQTIAVNVMVTSSTAPVLVVSTNLINLQEDFGSVVIGTTATDAETGTLVVTVSSTTHLVNMVISTRSITLSSLPNIFGTTTLTVRARDDGGLFVSTELVVIVAPVNDTPTLSVSANMVSLGSAPFVVNVTAFDIEDTTLSFSVSSGQGFVNTVITTTSLTISRTGIMSFQVVLSLRTTDTAGASVSTNITVVARPVLAVTTGIKTLNFAWDAVSSATYYRLRSEPMSGSGFTDLSTRGVVVSPNSTNISQTSAQALVSLHRYIPNVTNPQYGVDSCDATSCGTSFRHDTVTLNKAQLDSMIGRLLASNAGGNDAFGAAISLSGDGNTLAVGARGEQSLGTGINPAMRTDNAGGVGAVYLFRRNGGVWTEQAYIKASNASSFAGFGYSVSLSDDGNTLVVGAPGDGGTSTGVNGSQAVTAGSNVGAAYLFRFSTNTNAWAQQAYIKASNAGPSDFFGRSVSLSNDGNTLAVSAHLEDGSTNNSTNTGAVYVFRYSSSTWAEQAYLKASNPGDIDEFGERVHLSGDGNTLAVGAVREDGSSTGVNGAENDSAGGAGAVYVYRFSSSTWSQQAYIKASNARLNSEFGRSVSLSDDGNTLAVGATGEDTQFLSPLPNNFLGNSGAVYVFGFSTNTNTWAEQTFFKPSNINSGELFGWSVSLSSDGTALAAGTQLRNGSAAEVGGLAGPDTGLSRTGAAYVFELGNGTWVQQAYIRASDPTSQGLFGASLSLSSDGQTLAVGANGSNPISTGFRTGVVYLY